MLLRLCAGQPLLVDRAEVDLIDLVNHATELFDLVIDRDAPADDHRLAEIIVEYLCDRHGIDRHAGGKRLVSLQSEVGRYLLPQAIEMAHRARPAKRLVASLTIHDLKPFSMQLAGLVDLPAATVAGDLLRRTALECMWLSLADAAKVVVGGRSALQAAIDSGRLHVASDVRTTRAVVAPIDLRGAGLLRERTDPHGLSEKHAGKILRTLALSMARARGGKHHVDDFSVPAIKPPEKYRQRLTQRAPVRVPLDDVVAACRHLGIVAQVCLWLMRLAALRISETYGLLVSDFWRDENDGTPFLRINKQGGIATRERDRRTGQIVRVDAKEGAKVGSDRVIPIAEPLALLLEELIGAVHTDEDGRVRTEARLLPGIRKNGTAGQSAFRRQLHAALTTLGVRFTPHDMRFSCISDLEDAGVKKRVRFAYAGHKKPGKDIQEDHYLAPPSASRLQAASATMTARCENDLASSDLRSPTAVRESWGRENDDIWGRRDLIELRLRESGWYAGDEASGDHEVTARQAADVLGMTERQVRRLMESNQLASHQASLGSRTVRRCWSSDVIAFQHRREQLTLSALAKMHDLSYHQAYHLVKELAAAGKLTVTEAPELHLKNARILINETQAAIIGDELARRAAALSNALTLDETAVVLHLEPGTVGTLLRDGALEQAASPDGRRGRLVTRASVEAYNQAYPPEDDADASSPDVLLPFMEAARLMRVKRPTLSKLVRTRQVRAHTKPGTRHLYISVESIQKWAEHEGLRAVGASAAVLLDATVPRQLRRH